MTVPLLATKLYIPQTQPNLIERPHLLASLDQGLQLGHRLTLICAPAGYGKTTLLAKWARGLAANHETAAARPAPAVAWLSLDSDDNDPARFWAYVQAALDAAIAQPVKGAARRRRHDASGDEWDAGTSLPPGPPHLGNLPGQEQAEAMLAVMINEVASAPAHEAHPILLVLDDYHLIESPAIHRGLGYLLDHQPANLHLALATRMDPPLPLPRLRARMQVTELRQADLAFSTAETAELLNRVLGLGLDEEDVAALSHRAEGWAAGLQLAALAMNQLASQGRGSLSRFVRSFTGSNRYILDFLVEEVLQRQTPAVQRFLVETSVLERLCGPLCDAMLGRATVIYDGQPATAGDWSQLVATDTDALPPSAVVLQMLERANLFVVPMDDERVWYRYHRLFADLLRKRLAQTRPGLASSLNRRASAWYEAQGLAGEAIHHALAAGDEARAADLAQGTAETALMQGENATVLRWIEALPPEEVLARSWLCIYHAWALLLNGRDPELVEARLQEVSGQETVAGIAGAVATLRSMLAIMRGDSQATARWANQALRQLPRASPDANHPPESGLLRSVAANNLGLAHLWRGDMDAASQAFELVVPMALQAGNTIMAVAALCNLAGIRFMHGRLRQAATDYEEALELSTTRAGRRRPAAARALMGLAELAREWNNLEAAAQHLDEALGLCRQYGEMGSLVCLLTLSRVRLEQGDAAAAQGLLDQAQELASASRVTAIDDRLVAVSQARLWIALGELDRAAGWAQERGLPWDGRVEAWAGTAASATAAAPGYDLSEAELMTLVRLHLARKQPELALSLLRLLSGAAERLNRGRRLVEMLVLESIAWHQRGDRQKALGTLNRALILAEPEGYARSFLDEGAVMAPLLYQTLQRGLPPDLAEVETYAGRLLHSFASDAVPDLKHDLPDQSMLVEPLSARELEVLYLIAAGLTNSEISERLVISLSTVKGHTSNIYGKLGVGARTQAVARAREWGILDSS